MKASFCGVVSLVPALILIFASSARAELLVWQDFNSAPSIASLLDTGSTDTSRFYSIKSTPSLAASFSAPPGGSTQENRVDGIGTVGLVGGKLRHTLRGAWQTYLPSGPNQFLLWNSLSSSGEIVRLFPLGARPNLFFWRFKLKSASADFGSAYTALGGGSPRVRIFAGKSLFEVLADGGDRLRFPRNVGGDLILDGEVEISVLINKTAEPLDYAAPDETAASVGASAYDLWVNNHLIVDEGSHLAATPIDNVQLDFRVFTAATGSSGVPVDPGPAFEFDLDDILMRSDFEDTVPAGSGVMALSGNLNFGKKAIGSRSRKTLLIRNTGEIPMEVSQPRYPNPVFTGAFGGSIPAGGARAVSVTFKPKRAQAYRGSVTVVSTAENSPRSLPISGTGRK